MPLYTHELIHFIFSLIAGYIGYLISGDLSSFFWGLLGGFFVDADHFIDYFLAFGLKFKVSYFLKGYEFLKSDKIYILFHSWEFVILLFLFFLYFKNFTNFITLQTIVLSFGIAYFLHLLFDSYINHLRPLSYFLIYRIVYRFSLKVLVTDSHYQKHLQQKKLVTFDL